jgi:transposase InsO family protein
VKGQPIVAFINLLFDFIDQANRLAFSSFEKFKEWYNNRPHGSLEFEHLAIGHRLFGLWEEI